MFQISSKNNEDQIDVQYMDDVAIFNVYSPGGIGSATIGLETGQMPAEFHIRLHIKGLEQFRISSTQHSVTVSVSSSDPSHINIHETDSEMPILPGHPLWVQVGIISKQAGKRIPLEDGYFEVTLPNDFTQESGGSFQIDWIDFYR